MTLVFVNSSMDDSSFEQQLSTLEAEVDVVLAEAEQLLSDFNSVPHNNMSRASADSNDDDNSDIEEIVQEIPVVNLLDSTMDVGHESEWFILFFKQYFINFTLHRRYKQHPGRRHNFRTANP